uniref:Down syndrome cell adhesion molecule-like protein Dscam2 n=1 Tax=Strigamia maritima TaxID=126957 RepID=T1JA73_STRMM
MGVNAGFYDIAPEFLSVFEEKLQQPGTSVSLRCVARGVPLPQITWFLDDLPLPRSDRFHTDTYINRKGDRVSILNVTHMRVEDGGVYKCESQSSAGVVQHFARINIYGIKNDNSVFGIMNRLYDKREARLGWRVEDNCRPAVRPMPKMSVVAGHDVRINCAMYGYPIESVDWEKDGAAIPLDLRRMMLANGTLLIGSVERSTDSGRYRCSVRNKQGNTGTGEVEVVVMVSPKIIPFSFQDEYLREGTQARVMCALIEGDPPVKFQWLKDSRPIPSAGMAGIMVRNFDDFTSILTISNVASHHRGNYTCVAENAAASAAHTTPLKVNVPPTILPFSFQDEHLLEGMLASVSCVVSRGDLPLSLSWEKDGLPLVPSAAKGVNIMAHGDSMSILSIGPAFPVHNGNYTCVASNVASTMRYTAHLSVKVPPRWTLEPKNTMVLFGRSTVIHCQAEGFPPPSITWMKARGTEVTDQTDVLESGDEFHVFQNGSLLVKHATESHRGYYFCAATNGIGTGLSRGVFLQVHIPAEIETKMQSFTVVEGEIIRARCEAKGDHPIDFTWSTDGQTIESGQHSRYYFKDHVTPSRAVSELTVTNAQKMDTRIFVCMARNPYGGDMANIQIIVQGIPDAPKIIKIADNGNRSVELAWNPPYDGNSRITKYIVQYKPIQGDWTDEVSNLSVSGGQSSVIIRGLTPSVGYHFRMFSENTVGLSPPSDVVSVTMEDE